MSSTDTTDLATFLHQVSQVSSRVARIRADAGRPDPDSVLTAAVLELETASVQLEAAGEELRVQQEVLDGLAGRAPAADDLEAQLFERFPVALLVSSTDGMVLRASAAACDLLRRSHAALVGLPLAGVLPPGERRSLRTALSELARTGEALHVDVVVESSRVPGGSLRFTGLPGFSGGEHVVRWLLTEVPRPGVDTVRVAARDEEPEESWRATDAALADLAAAALHRHAPDDAAAVLARTAQRCLPHAGSVSLTLHERGQVTARGGSSSQALVLERLQEDLGEGPSVDALRTRSAVSSGDLAHERRWPRFARIAGEHAMSSVSVVPLVERDTVIGTLSAYGRRPDAPDAEGALSLPAVARLLQPALDSYLVVTRERRLVQELTEAMTSRAVIDQARGMIMFQTGCTADQAFERLRAASQRENVKLRDIAARLVNAAHTRR